MAGDLVLNPWRRGNRRRVYVNRRADRSTVGYLDEVTGLRHLDPSVDRRDLALIAEFGQLLDEHERSHVAAPASAGASTGGAADWSSSAPSAPLSWGELPTGWSPKDSGSPASEAGGWFDENGRPPAPETPAPVAPSPTPPSPPVPDPAYAGPTVPSSAPRADRGADISGRRAGDGIAEVARQRRVQNPVLRVLGRSLARLFGVRTADWSYARGAEGERAVGRRLDRLRRHGWHVLHSVDLGRGRGDIDHLLIGPGGLFTVNSKNHQGADVVVEDEVVFVRGKITKYAGKAWAESGRAGEALRSALRREAARDNRAVPGMPPVRSVVVIHGAARVRNWRRKRPKGVHVLPSRKVPSWFRRQPTELSPAEVDALFEVARWEGTWQQ